MALSYKLQEERGKVERDAETQMNAERDKSPESDVAAIVCVHGFVVFMGWLLLLYLTTFAGALTEADLAIC